MHATKLKLHKFLLFVSKLEGYNKLNISNNNIIYACIYLHLRMYKYKCEAKTKSL